VTSASFEDSIYDAHNTQCVPKTDSKTTKQHDWLVVEPTPSEEYEFVSWDDEIPNIWKVTKFMFQNTKLTFRTTHSRSPNPKIRVTEPPQKGHFEDPEHGFLF
jgi:hypothetical protein